MDLRCESRTKVNQPTTINRLCGTLTYSNASYFRFLPKYCNFAGFMKPLLLAVIFAVSLSSCSLWPKAWQSKDKSFSKILKSTDYDYKLKMAEKYYLNKDYNHAQQLYDDLYRV